MTSRLPPEIILPHQEAGQQRHGPAWTSGTATAGSGSLRFGREALTAEVGYSGELGGESTVNNLWPQVRYNF